MSKHAAALAGLTLALVSHAALGQPVVTAAVNAASNQALLSPGCWMSIYGTSLAPETRQATSVPLPATLSGVRVSVNGVAAPLLFVSPNQINALVPFEAQGAGPGNVTVTTAQGASAPHYVRLSSVAPALYTREMTGSGRAIVLSPSFQLIDSVSAGDIVILYAAGLGQTDPPARSDSGGASAEPFNRVPALAVPDVYVGDRKADVLFAGLAPGFPGVYQLNLKVPEGISSDRLILRAGLLQSNIAQVTIPAGKNTANVSGTITGYFPSDGSNAEYPLSGPYDISIMPQVTGFSVSMDILPNASPFTVLAVGESGSALIQIDPPRGTWQAANTVLSPLVLNGDYSYLGATVWDYSTCSVSSGVVCFPFPGDKIPRSRLFPTMVKAGYLLAGPGSGVDPIGTYLSTGSIPADRHIVIDSQTYGSPWVFGGLANIPLGYLDTRAAPLRLYADGKLVASKDVTYEVVTRPK